MPQPKPRPRPMPQPKPRPRPMPQPKPRPRPMPQPKPRPRPMPQPKPRPRPMPQPKPRPRPQPKPRPKPQPRPMVKPMRPMGPKFRPMPKPRPKARPQYRGKTGYFFTSRGSCAYFLRGNFQRFTLKSYCRPLIAGTGSNSCTYAYDGRCDDGRSGSHSSACRYGTDQNDCKYTKPLAPIPTGPNSCQFAYDKQCDDGRLYAQSSTCDYGTDQYDCNRIFGPAPQPNPVEPNYVATQIKVNVPYGSQIKVNGNSVKQTTTSTEFTKYNLSDAQITSTNISVQIAEKDGYHTASRKVYLKGGESHEYNFFNVNSQRQKNANGKTSISIKAPKGSQLTISGKIVNMGTQVKVFNATNIQPGMISQGFKLKVTYKALTSKGYESITHDRSFTLVGGEDHYLDFANEGSIGIANLYTSLNTAALGACEKGVNVDLALYGGDYYRLTKYNILVDESNCADSNALNWVKVGPVTYYAISVDTASNGAYQYRLSDGTRTNLAIFSDKYDESTLASELKFAKPQSGEVYYSNGYEPEVEEKP